MKKIVVMFAILVVAAVVYVAGCGIMDKASAIQPDYVGGMAMQPCFTNTVRSW